MGWFWTDTTPSPSRVVAPHPVSSPDAKPPPGCPMHNSSSAQSPFRKPLNSTSQPTDSKSCPYAPPAAASSSATGPSQSEQTSSSWISKINPLNLMPSLPNAPTSSSQNFSLPLERECSSIPRGPSAQPNVSSRGGCPVKHDSSRGGCPVKHDSSPSSPPEQSSAYGDADSDKWQYPSPQQMYNALLRKGYTDTDPTAVPAMVSVHNFLNEGAWAEILEWERRFAGGLATGWRISARGEENSYFGAMTELEGDGWRHAMRDTRARLELLAGVEALDGLDETPEPRLLRFEGRPQDRTPKSRWLQLLGTVMPKEYSQAPPFDRHDWYVLRHMPDGTTREVRYVIDYYSGPDESTGEPVFFLDVRPAIDGPTAFGERVLRWGGDFWWRSTGGAVREKTELERRIQELRKEREQKEKEDRDARRRS